MSVQPPTVEPVEPGEPSNRWPWVALALGLLVVVIAVAFFLFNRSRTVDITVTGTPTVNPVARVGTASPPPTLVPPTLPASATLAPSATSVPSPTPVPATPTPAPAPTQPPPTQPPPPPTQPPPAPATQAPVAAAAPTQPAASAATQAPAAPATSAPPPSAATATPAPAAQPSPSPFAGQVANAGGGGNTRADLDSALGPPAGETPEHLVVYRKNNLEYHVGFVPDPNGRAAVIVELPQQNAQPWSLEQAMAEGRKLLPKDAQPPNSPAEGNDQYVVERYTSQALAQALPAQAFTANKGQPGQFLVVFVKDSAQGNRITRIILGPGNDPQALIAQGR